VSDKNIHVHHVTRIEGHADIHVVVTGGRVETVRWEIPESPRLFEVMLLGRDHSDAAHIASRICGICSISHSIASLRASEAAFGIVPSEQTERLRRLLFAAEILESHILHIYFLAAPDFLGADSAFSLAASHREVVLRAMNLKRLAYTLADRLAGRKTHPISCVVGGFAKLPSPGLLEEARAQIEAAIPDLEETAQLLATFDIPGFTRETEYIGLTAADDYPFIGRTVASSDTGVAPIEEFLPTIREHCRPHSTAKHARHERESYMVGALARFNLNAANLHPRALRAAAALGLNAPCHNPYLITAAQAVEVVHAAEDSLVQIDALLEAGIRPETIHVSPRAGRGIGVVEAPRGLLIHDYTYDDDGRVTAADCIIPTAQNHGNIQRDFEALVPAIVDRSEEEIRRALEMLARAYDPCVSCSTHELKVRLDVER